ncbi:MAG: hypothetical protein QM715_13930 [Nibricoccus sp.]
MPRKFHRCGDRGLGGHDFVDGLAPNLIPEKHSPATLCETAGWIFLWAAGRLHNAVERDMGDGDNLSHDLFSKS